MNFYNAPLVVSMVDCGEYNQGIKSEKIGQCIAIKSQNTLLVIGTVNCGEFLQHTLSTCNFDDELL